MNRTKKYGEIVNGYSVPVLNEREIRAAAGMLFVVMLISLMLILLKENFLPIKYVISAFLADFVIRVFVNPKFSPTLIIGRLIVRGQNPEYVGAAPKRFAWTIGLTLAAIMFLLMVIVNSYSIITGLICLICLIFLFFESAFGICLGCLLYGRVSKEKTQHCPGEICTAKAVQDIQKISLMQIGLVAGFIVFVLFMAYLFNDNFSVKPTDLWILLKSAR